MRKIWGWFAFCFCILAVPATASAALTDACASQAQESTVPVTSASGVTTNATVFNYCDCLMFPNSTFPNGPFNAPVASVALPLFQCLTNTTLSTTGTFANYPLGLIPFVGYRVLKDSNIAKVFKGVITSMVSLSLAFFGVKIFFGATQNAKTEGMVLIFKVAGLMYFLANAPTLYVNLLNVMYQLSDMISSSASNTNFPTVTGYSNTTDNFWGKCAVTDNTGGTNTYGPPQTTAQLFSMWDCIFNYTLGLGSAAASTTSSTNVAVAGLLGFALAWAALPGVGMFVAMFLLYMIFSLLSAFVRFFKTFLLSVLGLTFMFYVGFMFVPLILFKGTKGYFERWMNVCFGFILTPVVTMGFMAMMLLGADILLFTGNNSLFAKVVSGSNNNAYSADASTNPITQIMGNPNNLFGQFWSPAQVSHASNSNVACNATAVQNGILPTSNAVAAVTPTGSTTIGGATYMLQDTPTSSANVGLDFKSIHLTYCYLTATTSSSPSDATTFNTTYAPDPVNPSPPGCTPLSIPASCSGNPPPLGCSTTSATACITNGTDANGNIIPVNVSPLPAGCAAPNIASQGIADQYGEGGVNTWKYITGIFYAVAVAAIFAYVMHVIMDFLPLLVDGLIGRGYDAAKTVQSIVGQAAGAGSSSGTASGAPLTQAATEDNKTSIVSVVRPNLANNTSPG